MRTFDRKSQININLVNRLTIFLAIFLLNFSCARTQSAETPANATAEVPAELTLGAARMDVYLPLLEGKRVALLVNHTSLLNDVHLVDTLLSRNINIVKVFAPEHGFRGTADAGESISDGKDKSTGLPIISLYGSNKKPSAEQMKDVDLVLFDIQDVGVRFYTYVSSMQYVMEACGEMDKEMMVLDRPNPNGRFVDGPVMEKEFMSFVGLTPIPVLHGMTVGELAGMINKEGWLSGGIECELTVVPMKNYQHDLSYSLPVKPSPNLPNDLSIQLYPSLCLFEGTVISVGRGTTLAFQQIGHPLLTSLEHSFTPVSIEGMAKYPPFENEKCYGTLFTSRNAIEGFDLSYLIDYYNRFPEKDKFFNNYFEKLAGTAALRKQIINGMPEAEIRESWQPDLDAFKSLRKGYLLYP
ncbi:exo-beta-N-acetylmuramidase NamZ domain-containing protein [Fulvivirga sedimenti]|uniref:DUF1343 domain-containing protein n=1 Tax=Fulvivirga sedimenti TaxID=2879465 RepID=A0A9X1HP26_9BACT|nr:DUF1343 domain-containing protein [Fulvivirga sedimenti]MCA6075366.1 DUF1343 domain-containing protein [Fulvivirga sedimenti]MCA6076543.1 DUF1343 domain-containing protein [Fulvivirga sedimenti]MCA6077671.1 DUF1343 domain-containing protein [Fulvivirga sedimenti]